VRSIDVKKIFGAAVKDWRHQLGLSQEELAERSDLHRTYISSVERGIRNVSLENITRLARALEISVTSLFPLSGRKDGPNTEARNIGSSKNVVDVLLIEDNPDDMVLALDAFKEARFKNRVQVISDGAEALNYIFARGKYARRRVARPQIILLDLNLPKVSGLEVLRRIKADKRTRMIPVIVLTVSEKGSDMVECRRLGVESYIVKPVDFQRLSQATPRLNLDWVLLKSQSEKSKIMQS